MPTEINTDVVICGSGSAGLAAAVWLAQAHIPFRMLERRIGPLRDGQADGVQCRTVEIYESFGIAEELLREAYHVTELAFWSTDDATGRLARKNRAADTPAGLSHQPHLILNQARMNGLLLEKLRYFAPEQEVDYDHEVAAVFVAEEDLKGEYPIEVCARHREQVKVYKAKYVLVRYIPPLQRLDVLNIHRPATAHTAVSAAPSASLWTATRPTSSGASWTFSSAPTFPTFGANVPSRPIAVPSL